MNGKMVYTTQYTLNKMLSMKKTHSYLFDLLNKIEFDIFFCNIQ